MSLKNAARLTNDTGLIERVAGGAAQLGLRENARVWATAHMWELSGVSGWLTAYTQGLIDENYTGDPADYVSTVGVSEDIITDDMILDAVATIITQEAEEARVKEEQARE